MRSPADLSLAGVRSVQSVRLQLLQIFNGCFRFFRRFTFCCAGVSCSFRLPWRVRGFFFLNKNRVSNSVFFEYELCAWIWCWFLDLEWWHCCVYGVILLMAELKLVYLSWVSVQDVCYFCFAHRFLAPGWGWKPGEIELLASGRIFSEEVVVGPWEWVVGCACAAEFASCWDYVGMYLSSSLPKL